jgi:hypothetical protein
MFTPRPLSPALTRFVECLAVTPYEWFVRPDGKLRAREQGRLMCALTGVARYRTGRTYSVGDWIHAGESIGLSPSEAAMVVDASDHCHASPRIERLRHWLLDAAVRTRPALAVDAGQPGSLADPAHALELT